MFTQNGYYRGIFFLILMMITSSANDVIAKFMGQRLDAFEVIFFRFFFSLITLIPFILSQKINVFRTSQIGFNIGRGVLGIISFYLYTYSLVQLQIVEVVTILWTIPLFVLLLSKIFLKETIGILRFVATIIGFVGLAFITLYDSGTTFFLKMVYLLPALSALLFAAQDVMIKKMVSNENQLTMLFYFALVTTILSLIPALAVWKTPTAFELLNLMFYGIFANLMQYFIFQAFKATELSALAPYRYLEFLISAIAGYVFFREIPGINVLIGASILIPSTLYLAYSETKQSRKDNLEVKTID